MGTENFRNAEKTLPRFKTHDPQLFNGFIFVKIRSEFAKTWPKNDCGLFCGTLSRRPYLWPRAQVSRHSFKAHNRDSHSCKPWSQKELMQYYRPVPPQTHSICIVISYMIYTLWYIIYDLSYMIDQIWYITYDKSNLTYHIWYIMNGISYMIFHMW